MVQGIDDTRSKEIPLTIIPSEKDAIIYAYKNAVPGSLITIMCDVVPDALDFIKRLKEQEDMQSILISQHPEVASSARGM